MDLLQHEHGIVCFVDPWGLWYPNQTATPAVYTSTLLITMLIDDMP